MRFDFNEANILKQNLFLESDTKEVLLHRLSSLLEATSDVILKHSIVTLIQKIESLTSEDVRLLYQDIQNKKLIATANFNYGK